ncbi:MAG TPA: hypothetical protein VN944_09870 [Nitrospiria bacterium]|nr:hypothetical protein [Nitrospiria bacterium]
MKKKLSYTLALFILFMPLAKGHAELSMNGNDWQALPESSKIYFVMGWMMSGGKATDNLMINLGRWDESTKEVENQTQVFREAGIVLQGVSVGQIIKTIDGLYSDPRLMTMDITKIMPFVSGRLIQGWTLKQLDEIVAIEVKLDRCDKTKKMEECSSLRKEKQSYLQILRGK